MRIASIGEIRSIEPIALGPLGARAASASQGACIFAGVRAGAKESSRSFPPDSRAGAANGSRPLEKAVDVVVCRADRGDEGESFTPLRASGYCLFLYEREQRSICPIKDHGIEMPRRWVFHALVSLQPPLGAKPCTWN